MEDEDHDKGSRQGDGSEIDQERAKVGKEVVNLIIDGFGKIGRDIAFPDLIVNVPIGIGFQQDKNGASKTYIEKCLVKGQAADGIGVCVNAFPEVIGHAEVNDIAKDGEQKTKTI